MLVTGTFTLDIIGGRDDLLPCRCKFARISLEAPLSEGLREVPSIALITVQPRILYEP